MSDNQLHFTLDTDPTPNIPLLRKGWEWVQAEARKLDNGEDCQWDQCSWINTMDVFEYSPQYESWGELANQAEPDCHTSFCFAGYIAHITPGVEWVNEELVKIPQSVVPVPIQTWARIELGLTSNEQHELFDGDNTSDAIEEILEGIFARAGEEL